jgi:phosphatidylserine decarboxylase
MATTEPLTPPLAEATAPSSIQPGGGFCMNLELAWGRLRRAGLRRFRRAYVRRMAEKRQGHCENCCHDVIDARDLKFFKNACGYWFRPEDDAFGWRSRLGLARAGLAEIVLTSLVFLVVVAALAVLAVTVRGAFWVAVALAAVLWFQLVFFFRDPERVIPADPAALLSPADGTITDVGEIDAPDFPGGRAFRIGIFLSIFSVHINRVPRAGKVVAVRYFRGCFLDARNPDCGVRNEQLWVDLEETGSGRPVRVKQISGAIARRIVCWLKPGDEVKAGERFGMIKFGSRTELWLPAGEAMDVQVKVGAKVKGGSTVLLRFTEPLAA